MGDIFTIMFSIIALLSVVVCALDFEFEIAGSLKRRALALTPIR
jgi:hypothetical protein